MAFLTLSGDADVAIQGPKFKFDLKNIFLNRVIILFYINYLDIFSVKLISRNN